MKRSSTRIAVELIVAAAVVGTAGCRAESNVLEGGQLVFEETFEGELGEAWGEVPAAWSIEDGWLAVARAHNAALWLQQPLPEQVRIEFDAKSLSPEGDLKFEVFGDGRTHESGYIGIFGGWSNQLNIIARQDEHGDDRLVGAEGRHVEPDRVYRFAIVRTDNRLRWYIDSEPFMTYTDGEPLVGEAHAHFAFNDWEAPLRFDNLRIYDLSSR